jgi:hypothetical protein
MAEAPAATYGNDPANTPLDKVRLLVGDTVCATAFLSDQEIEFFIQQEGDADFAAPCAAKAIAAKVARRVTQSAGGVAQTLSDLFKHYTDLAASLQAKANLNVTVYAGGLSVAEKELDRQDRDLVQPYFERGQMRNPDATSKPHSGDLRGDES